VLKELQINKEACNHCKTCKDVCYVDVIRWDEEKRIPYAAYPIDCTVCCICEAVCPQEALIVIPAWENKYYPKSYSTQQKGAK
jgi:NAD-dependent dihydropyrimidine dehydrogenase PreA subunit